MTGLSFLSAAVEKYVERRIVEMLQINLMTLKACGKHGQITST